MNNSKILVAHLFQHERSDRLNAAVPCIFVPDLFGKQRLQGVLVHGLSDRSHDKHRQKQSETDQDLVGRNLLRTHEPVEETTAQ
jgi:hypothetical protein